jgi:spermidine synthase
MQGRKKIQFLYLGVFFISIATLLLEITLTRIFSVAQWYHFAFMVISIAFLGFGTAGTLLAIKKSLLNEKNFERNLALFSGIFSLSIVICFSLTQKIPFDPFRVTWDLNQLLNISLYYILLGIPFFFSGLVICGVFSKIPKEVNKFYFLNLIGSGLGSFLVIGSFSYFGGGSGVIIFSSILGAFSTIAFLLPLSRKSGFYFSLGFMIFFLFLVFNPNFLDIKISEYKNLPSLLNYPDAKILLTQWNSFSRVDVIQSRGVRYAPGLSLEFHENIPEQIGITIDGNSLSGITKVEENCSYSKLKFLNYLPNSLAYDLKRNPRVLIIEPRGGPDVLIALYKNSSFIEISEPNPILVEILKDKFREFSGRIYNNPRVRVWVEDGRSFIRKSNESYDIIVISLKGDITKSSLGLYGLNENYLFTREAFQDFYTHLSENGFLVVTRWIQHPPRDGIRVISLAVDALENLNVKSPEESIIVVRSYSTITLFLKRGKFSKEEITKLKNFSNHKKFDLVYYTKISPNEVNLYNKFPEPYFYQLTSEILHGKREKLYSEYLFDLSPVSDDKPYFFSYFKLNKLSELYESVGRKWEPFFEGGFLVWAVFIQALFLSGILILLPLYFFKKIKKPIHGKFSILGYFFTLGLGYMLIEISLIQKFILFLGQPIFSISVIIFSLLTFSGLGSLFSEKFKAKNLKPIIITLSLSVLLYLLTLPLLFNQFISEGLFQKILISFLSLMPLGFLMGMPFPLGIKLAGKIGKEELIAWGFSTNAFASILGSILAIILALQFGFSTVLIFAAVIYGLGLGFIFKFL